MLKYIVLMLCVINIAVGQVLFKLSANHLREVTSMWTLFLDPIFILAVTLYGLTTLAWVWCLQEMPLNRAYPFMSLAYLIVPLFGFLFLRETLSIRYFLSVLLVISGILCSVWQ